MHRSPTLFRLTVALVMALGLWGAMVFPSLAQDATPTVEPDPTVEPTLEAQDVTGQLLLLYYLCDGNIGFEFTVGNPGEGSPNTIVDNCGLAPASKDVTFLVYPFGDLDAPPIEITTVEGVIMVDLPITDGTPHKISQKIEPLTQEEIDAGVEPIVPIQADFDIVEGTITGVNASLYQVGTVEIFKYRCEGDPAESTFNILNPGDVFDPAPYELCAADDRDFTITPFGDDVTFTPIAVSTVDGFATLDDVPTTTLESGRHHIVEDGTDLASDFDVEVDKTTTIVAVNYSAPVGSLALTKIVCVGEGDTEFYIDEDAPQISDPAADCAPAVADFSVYPFGDTGADPLTATTDENGDADIQDLPITEDTDPHLLIEDATAAEVTFNIAKDTVTTINVVNFQPPPAEDGTLEIEKLNCAGIAGTSISVGNPGDEAASTPEFCGSGAGSFVVYPFGDQGVDGIAFDVDSVNSVDLPPSDGTPHLLVEVDGNGGAIASSEFEIESTTTTPVQVLNPTYGNVQIYSYLCTGTQDAYFQAYAPGTTATLPSDCTVIDRMFYITIFGDDANAAGETISVSSVSQSSIVFSGIPATGAVSHTIRPSSGTATGVFDVNANTTTAIIYYTFQSTDASDTTDSESVTDLADTGIGSRAGDEGNIALFFALLSLGAVIGFSAFIRRRSAR